MGRLRQQERILNQRDVQQNGHRKHIRTFEEQQKLNEQNHVWFADMNAEEQAKLEQERASLWNQIPEHLRDKARRMAGN